MTEPWVDWSVPNVDGYKIAMARQNAANMHEANQIIAEQNAEIMRLQKLVKQLDGLYGKERAESNALFMLLRSMIRGNEVDGDKTFERLKKARVITNTELQKKGTVEYIKNRTEFRV